MVAVLSKNKKHLMPCTEKRARLLLDRGRAKVHNLMPFVIRMKDRTIEDSVLQEDLFIKLDPGSKKTGLAVVKKSRQNTEASMFVEIKHRGQQIRDKLEQRSNLRRGRRSRNLRYRAPRFNNRSKPKGWLAPSLRHRVDSTMSQVDRLSRWIPISGFDLELVRFDTQALQNPEISGVEYQQGTLAGYEVREYLLEKWNRKCAYCDKTDVPLQIDHIHPRTNGGSDRVSNLTLACKKCNQKKNKLDIAVFLAGQHQRLKKVLAQAKTPLKDAAAINSTRWTLYERLKSTDKPVTTSTGGRTKFNRCRLGIPKSHVLDALCVGDVDSVDNWQIPTLKVKCMGRGSYKRTRLDSFGFPRGYLIRQKTMFGFQTGDMVSVIVPSGKNKGTLAGRVAVRASGSFNIQTNTGTIQGISHRYCRIVQHADGYSYNIERHAFLLNLKDEAPRTENRMTTKKT